MTEGLADGLLDRRVDAGRQLVPLRSVGVEAADETVTAAVLARTARGGGSSAHAIGPAR